MIDLEEITKTTIYIKCYKLKRFTKNFEYLDFFNELLERIASVLYKWSGYTYVGIIKDNITINVFQEFFITLCDLIDFFDNSKAYISKLEKDFIKSIKYTGIIYRVLGYGNSQDKNKNKRIIPYYNTIFVSWSKNENNIYLDTKLYGKKTKIKAYIENNSYGLDLENFQHFINNQFDCYLNISKGNEREVIFPTLKEHITEITYE